MSDIAIRVENLGKMYRIGAAEKQPQGVWATTKNLALSPFAYLRRIRKPPTEEEILWALRRVSFEVKRGEVVGVIGRNGAGKSTLLKVLTRITEPTEGQAILKGRVGSLLEVGTGFHPELTGRENVYLSGTILGMRKADVDRKFDEIVDFSGVEKFIDTPVKRYSSGMNVRLGFAVAAHLDPEILLVDEVLAVGDAAFQKKALGKMGDVVGEGRTVLFVSHQMAAVENLCSRVVLFENGKLEVDGGAPWVIKKYMEDTLEHSIRQKPLSVQDNRSGNGEVIFTSFHTADSNGNLMNTIRSGEDVCFVFGYKAQSVPLKNVDIGFSLHLARNNQTLMVLYSSYQAQLFEIKSKTGVVLCQIKNFPLAIGRYRVGGRIVVNGMESDWPRDGIGFIDVLEGDFYGTGSPGFNGNTPFLVSGEWETQD